MIASVGTIGDQLKHSSSLALRRSSASLFPRSYDNALVETVNGLYKSEVIEYLKEDWTGVNDVELATLEWVNWFNKKRLHSIIG